MFSVYFIYPTALLTISSKLPSDGLFSLVSFILISLILVLFR